LETEGLIPMVMTLLLIIWLCWPPNSGE